MLRLLQWWWSCDRIRVSPREGRLLRLNPGDFLLIAGESACVLERRVAQESVHYLCDTAYGDCDLEVGANGDVIVRIGETERHLNHEQVETIAGPACSRRFNS